MDLIRQPLPEGLCDHERQLHADLAELQREFRIRAQPLLDQLAALEEHRPPPMILMNAEEAKMMAKRGGVLPFTNYGG